MREKETSSLRRMHHKQRRKNTMMLLLLAVIAFSSSLMTVTYAFSTAILYHSSGYSSSSSSSTGSKSCSSTIIYTHPEKEGSSSAAPSMSLEETTEEQKSISYPLHVIHQGHKTTINVDRDEPILQALERQSTSSDQLSLALSNIPHECRRGNCLTCASKIASDSNTNVQQEDINLVANIDNGLSPTIASELTKSGYVLTCCSYVTGPGVVLELDQNNEVWDAVYRQRLTDGDTKQVALEAQARLLRRVDEENVGRWKNKMEKVWSDE
jgi:ferredoxin